ncbi:hypothetical protein [Burkholderia cepacia]|uniref:hypothetical protein n=1 Tax=Burkholderia cepacia TaxID=292 RepID=UPI002AB714A8|nr:hypothetical protein [Burkholderia cepacia]
MTPRELLDAEIELLLLRYDQSTVLSALAKHLQLSEIELEEKLSIVLKRRRAQPRTKAPSSSQFSMDRLLKGRENKEKPLRQLYAKFENRTFLPELKDVKTFLDKNKKSSTSIKSRTSVKSKIFQLLAELELDTLEKLASEENAEKSAFSSLGIISDEILRQKQKK